MGAALRIVLMAPQPSMAVGHSRSDASSWRVHPPAVQNRGLMLDMSPKAITNRLELVSQLRALCLALGSARPVVATASVPEPKRAGARRNSR